MSYENFLFSQFLSKYSVSIPNFQRQYVWDSSRWAGIWEDATAEDGRFGIPLGMITAVNAGDKSKNIASIIDGQQRVITLLVFASAVRLVAKENALLSVLSNFETSFRISLPDEVLRRIEIRMKCDDNALRSIFAASLLPNGAGELVGTSKTRATPSAIEKAFLFFHKKLRQLAKETNEKTRDSRFCEVLSAITSACLVVDFVDAEKALHAFRRINNGIPLTDTELIRVYICESMDRNKKKEEEITLFLNKISDSLGSNKQTIEGFMKNFVHMWKERYKTGNLQEEFLNLANTGVFDLEALQSCAKIYGHIVGAKKYDGDSPFIRKVLSENLVFYRSQKKASHKMFLMSVLYNFAVGRISEKRAQKLVSLIPRIYIQSVLRAKTITRSMLSNAFRAAASGVQNDDDTLLYNKIGSVLNKKSLAPGWSSSVFPVTFNEHEILVLSAYERFLRSERGNPAKFEISPSMTIEHIAPKDLAVWKSESRLSDEEERELDAWSGSIGNKLLVYGSDNFAMKNACFAKKVGVYENISSEMARDISKHKTWTVEQIRKSQNDILEFLEKEFPMFPQAQPTSRRTPSRTKGAN